MDVVNFQYPFSGFFLFFRFISRMVDTISKAFNIHFQDSSFSSRNPPNCQQCAYLSFNIHFQDSSFSSMDTWCPVGWKDQLSISIFRILPFLQTINQKKREKTKDSFNIHFQDSSFSSQGWRVGSSSRQSTFNIHFQDSSFSSFSKLLAVFYTVSLSISIFRILPFLHGIYLYMSLQIQ